MKLNRFNNTSLHFDSSCNKLHVSKQLVLHWSEQAYKKDREIISGGGKGASPFGFPEKDVINFINGCKLGPDDARDFMLFLTYSNQISQATNGSSVDLTYATSLIKIINQLNKGSSDTALETNCTVAPSIIQSENVLTVSHSFAKNSPPRVPVNRHLKGFKPTIGKHNDAKFYPNIICVICKEWVCSRSRRIHIGAHFGYRKYVCSTCGFSHTKEIFVETHIRKCHNRLGFVIQKDDPSMECRIEVKLLTRSEEAELKF
ncbi:hypothetical protein ANCCEY_00696 [Ancylostoma ceylanicum]|uniref:C2H2-type domain-containing protein n=1 Tax=Ancylostoma ceylanicum TaxID=53326 RepID=A0A0D6MB91_9BILA|nr:hypothetical protein ANCCEY_00696 [Ancylostoma ceylanicum]